MCGICGIVNLNNQPVDETRIRLMMRRMKHRGPNDEGVFMDNTTGFGFVRLSILDLSPAGHQPMQSANGRYVIVFNGEIFNYLELREELIKLGHTFRTGTDTEVILAAFLQWGDKCLHRFNGMWAFAIYDNLEKKIFLARDRFGVKPLYYYQTKDQFIFASEISALHVILKDKLSIDELVVYDYLTHNRTDQTCDTFIKQIKRFEHGYQAYLTKDNKISYNQWYNLENHLDQPWKSPEEYKEYFFSSVQIRLRSDVPLGVCLSGGLDSSSITSALIKEFGLKDLYTFSAVYGKGKQGDESEFINIYADQLSNLTYVLPNETTLMQDFEELMVCHFEPFSDLSIYSQFKVLKDASKYVTVALDGQGADEQLGGYHYFFASHFKGLMYNFKLNSLVRELFYYYKNHRSTSAYLYFIYYILPAAFKKLYVFNKKAFLSDDLYYRNAPLSRIHSMLFSPKDLNSFLIGHFQNKLEHNLKWNDLNSMYHSVELRVPFLDYRIVEKTLATSPDKIIYKGTTKWILREAMKGVVPEKIRLRQDKVGFENPADDWFRVKLMRDVLEDAINSRVLIESGFFNMKEVKKLYDAHMAGKVNARKDLWKLININYFLKRLAH